MSFVSGFYLRTLTSDDAKQVTKLRTEAYGRQYENRVDLHRVAWGENDERFLNLGLFERSTGGLVSVLRLAYLKTALDFEKVVLSKHSPETFPLPLVVLGRGATRADCEGQGHHGVLRWAALKISKQSGAHSVVGTLEESSPRLKQMAELGYEFTKNENNWDGFLKNKSPIVIATLQADSRLDRAIEILAARFQKRNRMFEDDIDYGAAVKKLLSTKSFEPER